MDQILMDQTGKFGQLPVIEIDGLTLHAGSQRILNDIHLTVASGECLAIVGVSGAGKTSLLQLIGGINPGEYQGSLTRFGQPLTAGYAPEVGWLPQGLADNLNPHMTIAQHLVEALDISIRAGRHQPLNHRARKAEITRIASSVFLPGHLLYRYPRHLSGGEIQRVLLALSLIPDPELLLLDEPTASLDSKTKSLITQTLHDLKSHKTLILVTHDLMLARQLADRVIEMQKGRIIGCGETEAILGDYHENEIDVKHSGAIQPVTSPPVLTLNHLSLKAGERVLFSDFGGCIHQGETVLIYGESGSGKTTLARLCVGWDNIPQGALINRHGFCVYLSQHPRAACASHFSLKEILLEPMRLRQRTIDEDAMKSWLKQVHLPATEAFLSRKPATLSGGELQRLLIVRAMLADPDVLIADEPTSALDPALKYEMMACFKAAQRHTRCALVIFTHDPVIQELMNVKGVRLSARGLIPY